VLLASRAPHQHFVAIFRTTSLSRNNPSFQKRERPRLRFRPNARHRQQQPVLKFPSPDYLHNARLHGGTTASSQYFIVRGREMG
jgi:hypothetical protein